MRRTLHGLTGSLIVVAIFTALLPAFADQAPDPDPNRLSSYLAADTVVYLEVPSVPAALRALERHPIARLLHHEEVTGFAGFYLGMARGFVDQFLLRSAGVDLEGARSLFAGRIEFAVPAFELKGERPDPHFALAVDVSGAEEKARALAQRLIGHVTSAGHEIEETELAGVKAWVYPGQPAIHCFFARGRLFAAAGRPLALRLAEGKPIDAPRLADDPDYRRMMSRVRADGAHAHMYLAWGEMLERGIEYARRTQDEEKFARAMAICHAVGILNFRRYAVSLRFDERGCREIDHVDIEGEPTGLATLTGAVGAGLGFPARMSAGTLLYHGGRLDLARTWNTVHGAFRALADNVGSPTSELSELVEKMAAAENGAFGFKLKDDLLAALGDEYGVAVGLSPSGGVIPDAVAAVKVKDPERVRATVARLAERLAASDEVRVTTGRLGDTVFRVFRGMRPGLTPSVAVQDDVLVVGITVQSLKRFLRPSGERLPAGESYRRALADVGLQDLDSTSFLTYLDLPRSIRYGYDMMVPALSMVDADELGLPFEIDVASLPSAETLAGAFSPIVSVKRVTPDGVTTESITPLPVGVLWFAGFAAGIARSGDVSSLPAPPRERKGDD